MIVQHGMSLEEAWKEVNSELKRASVDSRHPFRYVVLGTINVDGGPSQRTVVFRGFTGVNDLLIHTDSRSEKISEIKDNPKISLLFYNDKKKLQLRISGKAMIHEDDELYRKEWNETGIKSKHSYTSERAPGEALDDPEDAYEWNTTSEHFTVLRINVNEAEFLQLDGKRHLRSRRIYSEEGIKDQWLVP